MKLFKNKIFIIILLSISVFIITFFIRSFFTPIDNYITYGIYLKHKNIIDNYKTNSNIIVVEIDDYSLKKIGHYPFSREVYAKVFDRLKEKGVGVVGLDVILGNNGPDEKIDNKLAKSIRNNGNIVLGSAIFDGNKIELPLKKFRDRAAKYGFFNPHIDRNSNMALSFYPEMYLKDKGKLKKFYSFDIQILREYFKINNNPKIGNEFYYLSDNIKIPLAGNGRKDILINFKQRKDYQKISISDIYFNTGRFNQIDFKNKIVLIGATAQGLKDIFNTPNGVDFGIYVHANIINTVLEGKFLYIFNKNLELALIFLLIVVAIYFNFTNNSRILGINIAIFVFFMFLPYFTFLMIKPTVILNHSGAVIFGYILSSTFSNFVKFIIENKNKRKLVKALGEYISPDIAREILNGTGRVKLDGDNKKISIFFSDIAGFTTISEKMNPEELVNFLREYLGAMSNIIINRNGFIDKYEGDAIMALYGVFAHEEVSTYDNCKAAIEQQKLLKELNISWKERFGETLKVRMGIHTGYAITGNIGAIGKKVDFTALGDSVNLASRLEGVNKFYNTLICISEDAVIEVKDKFEFRKLDKIRVKGKNKPIVIYELLGYKGKITKFQNEIKLKFEYALQLYFENKFKEAIEFFIKLDELGDLTSKIFIKRCNLFINNPPKNDWDGVWTLKEK